MKTRSFCFNAIKTFPLSIVSIAAVLLPTVLFAADRDGRHESRGSQQFRGSPGVGVERFSHGTIRHSDSHVFRPPAETFHGGERRFESHNNFFPRHDVFVHRDVDVDFHHPHFWSDFGFHRHVSVLPSSFLTLNIRGAPYYYSGGIYYQPGDTGGYVEVYPPAGAAIPQPPEGSIQIYAGGQTYYYAGGAFYVQQPDGQFVIAPTPIGVVVPELPPGAIEVNLNGKLAYQFNGVYYEPVFVNGVTQYQTFVP
jgi:hypothetical protein